MEYKYNKNSLIDFIHNDRIKNGAFERVYFQKRYLPDWHYASSYLGSILGNHLPEANTCNHAISNTYFDRICLN